MSKSFDKEISSARKTLHILQKFTFHHSVWRVGELSEALGFSKSTVSRLIQTLVEENFLEKDEENLGYRIGPAIFSLGGLVYNENELYQEVTPVLNQVVLETGESAHISVLNNNKILYLNKLIGPYYTNLTTKVGGTNPAHATSSGKVLLAHQTPEVVEAILGSYLEAYTEFTVVNPIKIRKTLETVRKQGYAITTNELLLDHYSIATPVFNSLNKVVCAITIVGPISRLNEQKKERFTRLMVKAAKEASQRLGYDG